MRSTLALTTLLVIIALVLVNALYVAAEFAAVGVRHSQVQKLANDGHWLARLLLPVVDDTAQLDRYIAACQIGITLSSLVLGAYGQATLARELGPLFQEFGALQPLAAQSTAALVVLIGLTATQMVFGELVPKSLALQYPLQIALYTHLPMRWSLVLLKGFIFVLNGSGNLVLRALRVKHSRHRHVHSPDEIDMLIAESREVGLLRPDEQQRLHQALFLSRRTARQFMVPRRMVTGVAADTSPRDLLKTAIESPFSSLLVYEGAGETPIGILHAKDLSTHYVTTGKLPTAREIMREPVAVLGDLPGDRLLAIMRERHVRKVVVIDEFGTMRGLVTLDDVLSMLVGDVGDEFKEGRLPLEPLADGRFRLPGTTRLDEAAALTGLNWSSDASTVAGFIITALERIPEAGERFTIDGIDIEIERMAGPAIDSVLVAPAGSAGEEGR